MRSTLAAVALAALVQAASAATAARVFTYDPHSPARPDTSLRSLNPVAARVVLAQRVHVEEFHSSDLDRQDVIDAINEYGVKTPLFGKESGRTRKALLMVENAAASQVSSSSLQSYRGFQLDSAPSGADLFVDLARQLDRTSLGVSSEEEALKVISRTRFGTPSGDTIYIASSMGELESYFKELAKEGTRSVTALVTYSNGDEESAGELPVWGTYEMPSQQNLKRQSIREQPLIEKEQPGTTPNKDSLGSFAKKNATIIRGILPACFHSLSECEKRTSNCTGRGSCRKEYHDKSAPVPYDCFSCKCGNTTTKKDGLVSTTYWSGPACQKKDVSVEFWLIVLFTLGLIFLVGFAVGQIWEMGDQQLPSVIGAGVSGPTARK